MENLIINFCYSLAEEEAKLANIDKLKLALYLCKAKMEKDIELPFKRITVIGTDYIQDEYADLLHSMGNVLSQSRKIGVSFVVYNKEEQTTKDFYSDNVIRKHNVNLIPAIIENTTSDSYLSDEEKGYLYDFMDVLCYEFIYNRLKMNPDIHGINSELSEDSDSKNITVYITKSLVTKKALEIRINLSTRNSLNKVSLIKETPELLFDGDRLIVLEVDSLDKLYEVYTFVSSHMRKFGELHHLGLTC